MKETVLVTGAGGFIGSHLALRLRQLGVDEVVTTTRKGNDDATSCDLGDLDAVTALLGAVRPHRIFHCAGSFSNCWNMDVESNVKASGNVLEAVTRCGLKTRILLFGSAAEYGDTLSGAIAETSPVQPVSIYGLSKAMQTAAMHYYAAEKGVDIVLARTFNLYGDGISPLLFPGRVLHQIEEVKAGRQSRVKVRSIESSRDYLDVNEAVEAYLRVMAFGEAGEIYNVGSGNPTAIKDLLEKLLAEGGLSLDDVEVSDQNGVKEAAISYAEISKLAALPRFSSESPSRFVQRFSRT